MQLTRFTDLGLRVLMYLGTVEPSHTVTIAEISSRFDVAHHHLTKVVQFMGQQGWLLNVRGKGGGVRLAQAADAYRLGQVVRALERGRMPIDCSEPPCALQGSCGLKGVLDGAAEAFYTELDQHTLAHVLRSPTREALVRLQRPTAVRKSTG